jgi:very-short-patch-repair endonuclease
VLKRYADMFNELLAWWAQRWAPLHELLEGSGFDWETLRSRELARSAPTAPFELEARLLSGPLEAPVATRLAVVQQVEVEESLGALAQQLAGYDGAACASLRAAVRERDAAGYTAAHDNLLALIRKSSLRERRVELLERMERAAPMWAWQLRHREGRHAKAEPPGEPSRAWRWRQLQQEIQRRAELNEFRLTRELADRQAALQRTTADLIDRRAWLAQLARTDLSARSALQGWADTVRRIGRGTGVRVPQLQAEARRLLTRARDAVPVWIMPLSRVAESFDPCDGKFDVVILDEASQADLTGLLAWYLGDRVAVVGDHEQVSPLAVGQDVGQFSQLIADHLQGIPNSHLYDGRASVYDLARQCFGGAIALREHFRCVPDIIGFSDELCYDFEIRPLRPARSAQRPHIVEYVAGEGGGRSGTPERFGKTNVAEARAVVSLIKAATELTDYDDKTMGVITLLGDDQAGVIHDLAVKVVGAVELERRRFLAGNAAHFQGDERDVVFLSMVDVGGGSGPLRMLGAHDARFKQRYNVAASRARDQLWLVHSLNPDVDLQEGDLRKLLIEYVRKPGLRRGVREAVRQREASELEKSVADRLIAAGYQVQPQYRAGSYRIDLVVSDEGGEVAIECDGDRFCDLDQIPSDMVRQAVLERAGWRFIRIRGTRFWQDPDVTMDWVMGELAKLGVEASGLTGAEPTPEQVANAFRERVVTRAKEILREVRWG